MLSTKWRTLQYTHLHPDKQSQYRFRVVGHVKRSGEKKYNKITDTRIVDRSHAANQPNRTRTEQSLSVVALASTDRMQHFHTEASVRSQTWS